MKKNDIYLQLLVHYKIHQHSTVYLTYIYLQLLVHYKIHQHSTVYLTSTQTG